MGRVEDDERRPTSPDIAKEVDVLLASAADEIVENVRDEVREN